MKKSSIPLSLILLVAMVLTACGAEDGGTEIPASPPPVTADSTDDLSGTPTESPTVEATAEGTQDAMTTETPGVPVTGDVNPARISNQLDFTVWSQDGEQIGEVDDMVLDLNNTMIAYVVVGTGGFLDLGERDILVPWESLELQTGSGDTTGGQQNAFILQEDVEVFRNAPDFDLSTLPEAGQPADDWDVDISTFWESGGTTGGAAGTPTAAGTTDMTATSDTGAGTGQATATADTGTGQATATAGIGTGTDDTQGQELQGVVLASDVLGATITLSPGQGEGQGQGQGTGTGQATATADTGGGTGQATATPDPGAGQATATAGTGTGQDQGVGNIEGTIDDLIVAIDTGEIQYLVVNTTLDDEERLIPVPLSSIQWNAANGAFVINANPATFRDAPFFTDGQYPDMTSSGWNSEFDTFWHNNGGGSGAQATPTP